VKQTTPTYGEEKTGKATFEVKVSEAEIGPMEPGCNVMLYDIYINLQLAKKKNPEILLDFYKNMLKIAEQQPDGSYYSNHAVKHNYKDRPIIIKKEDLVNQIKELIKNHPIVLEAYKKEKEKQKQRENDKHKEKEKLKNQIISRLLDLETSIDSYELSPELLLKYRIELKKIESLLTEKFMSDDVFNINGRDYMRGKTRTYARDLLEIVESQIQESGVSVEETRKDAPKR